MVAQTDKTMVTGTVVVAKNRSKSFHKIEMGRRRLFRLPRAPAAHVIDVNERTTFTDRPAKTHGRRALAQITYACASN